MLLKLYKGNRPFVIFFIIITSVFFWMGTFLTGEVTAFGFDKVQMPLYALLGELLPLDSMASSYLALILIFINAFFLVQLNTKYVLINERTYLPALIYLFLVSSYIPMQRFHPALIGSFLFIFIIGKLLETYKQEGISFNYFEAAFLLSLGSLFYFNYIFFLPVIWIGLIIFRPFIWREWIFTVIGFSIPYIFLFAYYYLVKDTVSSLMQDLTRQIITSHPFPVLEDLERAYFMVIAALVTVSSLYMIWTFTKKKIQARKYFLFFFWMFLIIVLVFLFLPYVSMELISCAAIPVSYLISHFFIGAKSHYWGDFFLLVCFVIFGFLEFSN